MRHTLKNPDAILTAKELAAALRVTVWTVHNRIKRRLVVPVGSVRTTLRGPETATYRFGDVALLESKPSRKRKGPSADALEALDAVMGWVQHT